MIAVFIPAFVSRPASDGPAWPVPIMIASYRIAMFLAYWVKNLQRAIDCCLLAGFPPFPFKQDDMQLRTTSTLALSMFLLHLAAHPSQAAILTNGSFETGDFTGFTRDAFLNFNAPTSGIPSYQT